MGGSFLRHFEILSWRYFDGEDNVESYKVPQINPVKDYIKAIQRVETMFGKCLRSLKEHLKMRRNSRLNSEMRVGVEP